MISKVKELSNTGGDMESITQNMARMQQEIGKIAVAIGHGMETEVDGNFSRDGDGKSHLAAVFNGPMDDAPHKVPAQHTPGKQAAPDKNIITR